MSRTGQSCGPGRTGKRDAKQLAKRIWAELLTGTYQRQTCASWPDFRRQHADRILSGMKPDSASQIHYSMNHFERLCKPKTMKGITTAVIDRFKVLRRNERGYKPGSKLSPDTINRDSAGRITVFRK